MIAGKLALEVRGFSVQTDDFGNTSVAAKNGDVTVTLLLVDMGATDLANAIRRSASQPGERVTSRAMREMRAASTGDAPSGQ